MKKKLYTVLNNCSLSDYCIFNRSDKDMGKNEFFKLVNNVLNKNIWFNVSDFIDLGECPTNKGRTQVAFVDNATKEEEFDSLSKIFTEKEIETLILIIENMKSYGVYPIKELMDNEDEVSPKYSFMRSAFFRPFSFGK